MGIWGTVGKGAVKVGKFLFKHRKEVAETAGAVASTASAVREIRSNCRGEDAEQGATFYDDGLWRNSLDKIQQHVEALEEFYDKKTQDIEYDIQELSAQLAMLRNEIDQTVQNLNGNLQQLAKEQEVYRKKTDLKLVLIGVAGGVGSVAAIVLAVVL